MKFIFEIRRPDPTRLFFTNTGVTAQDGREINVGAGPFVWRFIAGYRNKYKQDKRELGGDEICVRIVVNGRIHFVPLGTKLTREDLVNIASLGMGVDKSKVTVEYWSLLPTGRKTTQLREGESVVIETDYDLVFNVTGSTPVW